MLQKNNKIFFLINDSITSPIIKSHGLAYFREMANTEFDFYIISMEDLKRNTESIVKDRIKELSSTNIKFFPIFFSRKKWLPSILQDIILLTLKTFPMVEKDVVFHCRSYEPTFVGLILKKIKEKSARVIFDMRGLWSDEMVARGLRTQGSLRNRIDYKFEKYLLKNSDKIVVMNWRFKEVVYSRYKELKGNKIDIIQNIYDPKRFSNVEKRKKETRDIILGYIGSTDVWHNFETMINIFEKITGILSNENVYFHFGTYRNTKIIEEKTNSTPFRKNIIVRTIDYDGIPNFISNFDIGFSLHGEKILDEVCSPIKIAEYLASGKPVILNKNVKSYAKLIKETGTGYVIEDYSDINFEELARFILDVKMNQKRYKLQCMEVADNNFNLAIAVKKYASLYRTI